MVDIVIPIYRENPKEDDKKSIGRAFSILGNHPITFIHPKKLNLKNYSHWSNANFLAFDNSFFKDISGYNKLMMSKLFYESFSKKFILVYQTDALVFKDELEFWCEKDYDYIGAPWIGSQEEIPFLKYFFEKTLYHTRRIFNYKNNQRWQKDKSLIYNHVGNGGFSLRKREKCLEIITKLRNVVEIYLKRENQNNFFAEDVFFSIEPKRNGIAFSKPDFKEALLFSVENKLEKAFKYNQGKMPFGCHRWHKENRKFWKNKLKNEF